jgi:glycosyltransferase involved in cell wall biosynthesis
MSMRRRLVTQVDAFVATGRPAAAFIEGLGAHRERVVVSCLPSALAQKIAGLQRSPGPTRPPTSGTRFLFVGRLVELKRPLQLADAFLQAAAWMPGATLTYVGDGPLRVRLTELAGGDDRIRLEDRAEGDALIGHYQAADVLVVPSVREVWGLVVNEGLAAGLYVVATDQVAAAVSLLNAPSGLLIPANDDAALVAALRTASRADQSAEGRSGRVAQVHGCTSEAFAGDLATAVHLALSQSLRRRGARS